MGKRYLLILLMLIQYLVYGQTTETKIWGEVRNTSGDPMDYAGIVVMNPDQPNKILASTYTDDQGKYQISVHCGCDSLMFRVSRIEMKPVVVKIPNRSGENNIKADIESIALREVMVKAKKIYSEAIVS